MKFTWFEFRGVSTPFGGVLGGVKNPIFGLSEIMTSHLVVKFFLV